MFKLVYENGESLFICCESVEVKEFWMQSLAKLKAVAENAPKVGRRWVEPVGPAWLCIQDGWLLSGLQGLAGARVRVCLCVH